MAEVLEVGTNTRRLGSGQAAVGDQFQRLVVR